MNFERNQGVPSNLRCKGTEEWMIIISPLFRRWWHDAWVLEMNPVGAWGAQNFEKTTSTTPNSLQPSRLHRAWNIKRKEISGWIKFTFAVICTVGMVFSKRLIFLCLLYIEDVKTIVKNHKNNITRYLWLQYHQYLRYFSISTKSSEVVYTFLLWSTNASCSSLDFWKHDSMT